MCAEDKENDDFCLSNDDNECQKPKNLINY